MGSSAQRHCIIAKHYCVYAVTLRIKNIRNFCGLWFHSIQWSAWTISDVFYSCRNWNIVSFFIEEYSWRFCFHGTFLCFLEAWILELLNNQIKLCSINIQQFCPYSKTTLMICFQELVITFHPCSEGLNQPFSTYMVSLHIWGWRLVSRGVNEGSLSSSGIANMDCVILPSKEREAAWHTASSLSVKTDTYDLNLKDYLCFVALVCAQERKISRKQKAWVY